jgi:chemotaxis protein MotA
MALPVGLVLALVFMLGSSIMEGGNIGALIAIPSVVLVMGGTWGATVAAFAFGDIFKMPGVCIRAMTKNTVDLKQTMDQLIELGDIARKEGQLALESRLGDVADPFLKHGLTLLVDGADESRIREELDGYSLSVTERHTRYISILSKAAGYAPIFGLMGTTMGLINMLGELNDPSKIGPHLAAAMTATLYGLITSNVIYTPIADKLTRLHESEMLANEMTLDGVCTMLHGLSGRAMVERLQAWLPPSARGSDEKAKAAA